jgi:hypothetical protein
MNTPLEILKKGLLQQNRLTPTRSLSPSRYYSSPIIHHPNPKRFNYRVELLRERYLVSIHAIHPSDIVHEFIYIPSITPPLAIQRPSPQRDQLPITLQTSSADFIQVEPLDDNMINDVISDMELH